MRMPEPPEKNIRSPLQQAIIDGNEKRTQELLKNGADVNYKSTVYGETALHMSASFGDAKLTEQLIKRKANVNATDKSENTPLHYACMSGNDPTAKILLERGADWTKKNGNGLRPYDMTPLKSVCRERLYLYDKQNPPSAITKNHHSVAKSELVAKELKKQGLAV